MRFDQTEGAIVENSCGLHRSRSRLLTGKPEVMFALVGTESVSAVDSIFCAISTMDCTQGLGCLSPGCLCVSGANQCAPLLHGSLPNEFHANDYIALDEGLQTRKEWLIAVLGVECFTRCSVEF